ncbi:MAG: putative DNA binding domain-containing protein [Anaerolineae bacterium]|nr:putative DNA binding domain-containing protein [Anaerolineae bacterium]
MDVVELLERIRQGEDLHTEFKETDAHHDDIAATIVAFANTDGGQLIFGVSDQGQILGVKDPDRLMQRVDQIAYQNCEPPLTVIQETVQTPKGTVVVVHVPKGDLRPYRTNKGEYFIRTTTGRRRASRQELLRLFQAAESLFYEEILILQAGLEDIDLAAFERFCTQTLGETGAEAQALLVNWRLVMEREGRKHPTVAALLLFGREPQAYLPYAYITAARISGQDLSGEPSDIKRIQGTLFQMLEDAARFLSLHLPKPHRIRGFEPEAHPELPEEALREVVVNALVHRDYTIHAPIRIFILDDRVEVRSPGLLPNTVTVEMIKAGLAHVLRNPLLYSFFVRAGFVTDTGNGFRRAMLLVKEAIGREPDIRQEGMETIVVIPRSPAV